MVGALALGAALPAGAEEPTIAAPFRAYHARPDGARLLGAPVTGLLQVEGRLARYFEKGRIEDHHGETDDPRWQIVSGRLAIELMERAPALPVNATSLSYWQPRDLAEPARRRPAPGGDGPTPVPGGVFVPHHPHLPAAPGHVVPAGFWGYINRADLFPGGWLHDVGLPPTPAVAVETNKGDGPRTVTLQAFERAVLTDDPRNPPAWRIERGNIGADAVLTGVLPPGGHDPAIIAAIRAEWPGDLPLDITVQRVEGGFARAYPRPRTGTARGSIVFLKQVDGAWRQVGAGTAFDDDFHGRHGIPLGLQFRPSGDQDAAITAAVQAARPPGSPSAAVLIQRVQADHARVLVRPAEPASGGLAYPRHEATGWRLLHGPGAAGDPRATGVPAWLVAGNRLETALEFTARGYGRNQAGAREFAWAIDRVEAGFARGRILPTDGGAPITLFAREEQGAWLILALPTPPDPDAYTALGIPRALAPGAGRRDLRQPPPPAGTGRPAPIPAWWRPAARRTGPRDRATSITGAAGGRAPVDRPYPIGHAGGVSADLSGSPPTPWQRRLARSVLARRRTQHRERWRRIGAARPAGRRRRAAATSPAWPSSARETEVSHGR